MVRKNDNKISQVYFQVDRFVQQNGEWFYVTREGVERGPFVTKESAKEDLTAYVYHLNNVEQYGHYF
ncbi:MAG: hypothetical protein COA54_01885 [Thiotrichaceae bacterium]|nr:MAG: hypothetical protein COA54_01885 [Thiotrichaceae bacterium]